MKDTIAVTVEHPFHAAVAAVRDALATQGFGVLTEVGLAGTLHSKLGVDLPAQRIPGACNPPLALRALQAEESIGVLLPCNITIRAIAADRTVIETLDPMAMVTVTDNERLRPVADEASRPRRCHQGVRPNHSHRGRCTHGRPARRNSRREHMELDASEMSKVVNRLKRAQGQLAGVVRMLEEGQDCEPVVTQLSAVSKALDRAGFAIIASGMKQCLRDPDNVDTLDVDKLQKLFLSLA